MGLNIGVLECIGNRTECGLLKFVNGPLESDFQFIRDQRERLRVVPFTSERKRMSVLISSQPSLNGKAEGIFHLKGAPEIVLDLCKYKVPLAI